jgi:hypothetical protein
MVQTAICRYLALEQFGVQYMLLENDFDSTQSFAFPGFRFDYAAAARTDGRHHLSVETVQTTKTCPLIPLEDILLVDVASVATPLWEQKYVTNSR